MALKEARRQANVALGGKAENVLKFLKDADPSGLTSSLSVYLTPLLGSSGEGKENDLKLDLHNLAREYVPFLLQILKLCGSKLTVLPTTEDSGVVAAADEMFSAMALALDGLNQLRSLIVGCSYEIEVHRYGLIRRLMARKRFSVALEQSQMLFRSLCRLAFPSDTKALEVQPAASKCTRRTDKRTNQGRVRVPDCETLCPPMLNGLADGLPALIVGAVIDLIWCTAEGASNYSACYIKIAQLPKQLAPWISLLDADNVDKQRNSLFRALYKCTLVVLNQATLFEASFLQEMCKLTLDHCSSSSQRDQYAKVARKFCGLLSSGPANGKATTAALEICREALSDITSCNELEAVRRSIDVLELVDWFSRCCEASNKLIYGWRRVFDTVCSEQQVRPDISISVAGLYGVTLFLKMQEAEQRRCNCEISSQSANLQCSGCDSRSLHEVGLILVRTMEVLMWISELPSNICQPEVQNSLEESGGCRRWWDHLAGLKKECTEFLTRLRLSIIRAFQYMQKPALRYVQTVWNAYVTGNDVCSWVSSENLNTQLRKILKLCPSLIAGALGCPRLSENDRDYLSKSFQLSSQMSVAALRLALLQNDSVEDMVTLVVDGLTNMQPEELSWLMSSTYNMGVQMFNGKHYSFACWALHLSCEVAWAKIESISKDGTLDIVSLSEACQKCSVLADARTRSGELAHSRGELLDGLRNWARFQSLVFPLEVPQALVKSYVKLKCLEKRAVSYVNDSVKLSSLYKVLCTLEPRPSDKIMGLLLEEEIVACKILREQFPDETLELEAETFNALLDYVYKEKKLRFHRCRILIEKSQCARVRDSVGPSSCIHYVTEALQLMEQFPDETLELEAETFNALLDYVYKEKKDEVLSDGEEETEGDLWALQRLNAVASSIMALYLYEMNPQSQDSKFYTRQCLDKWKYVLEFSSIRCPNGYLQFTREQDEEHVVLLLSLVDVLFIQGYSVLLEELYGTILKVSMYMNLEEIKGELLSSIMNRSMSHLLCYSRYSSKILSTTRQHFGSNVQASDFWKDKMGLLSGSMLETQHLQFMENSNCRCGAEKFGVLEELGSLLSSKNEARLNLLESSGSQKSFEHVEIRISALCSEFQLSNSSVSWSSTPSGAGPSAKGLLTEAVTHATEAYTLRSQLFKRAFLGFERRSTTNAEKGKMPYSEEFEVLALRGSTVKAVPSSWPFIVNLKQFWSSPSHWRVLGDYVESLMQVGSIYEKMGAPDDAERFLREGHRIATAQNSTMAIGFFKACLGEVHRKRLMWESAEKYLFEAKHIFENLDISLHCSSCRLAGRATLELRIGDLVRHNWFHQKQQRSHQSSCLKYFLAEGLDDAVSCYAVAASTLTSGFSSSEFMQEVLSVLSSEKQKMHILSSLRDHGKVVSNRIMAAVKETPPSNKTRRTRVRRSAVSTEETSIEGVEGLLQNLSLASTGGPAEPPVRKTRSRIKTGQLRGGEGANCAVSENHSGVFRIPGRSMKSKDHIAVEIQESPFFVDGNKNVIGSTREPVSVEEWANLVLRQQIQSVLARVLLRKGKCFTQLGRLDEGTEAFNQALEVLYGSCSSCLSDEFLCCSNPVEEASVLYHLSRLKLQTHFQEELEGQNGGASEGIQLEILGNLHRAFNLCHQFPAVLRQVAKFLALHYTAVCTRDSELPQSIYASGLEAVQLAAYFHQVSIGATSRQLHLAALDAKIGESLHLGGQHDSLFPSIDRLYNMRQALRITPLTNGNGGRQAKEFLQLVAPLSACCVSVVDVEDVRLVDALWGLADRRDFSSAMFLLLTRFNPERTPVVVLLPIGPLSAKKTDDLVREGVATSDPYCISDDEETSGSEDKNVSRDTSCTRSTKSFRLLKEVVAEFEAVLEESRQSTSSTESVTTPEQKNRWWRWRMQLDKRLERLLRSMETSWLGFYKCLLLGEPRAKSSDGSFGSVFSYLLKELNAAGGSVGGSGESASHDRLLELILKGAGSFTDLELESAVGFMLELDNFGEDSSGADSALAAKQKTVKSISRALRSTYDSLYCTCENHSKASFGASIASKKQTRVQTRRSKQAVQEVAVEVVGCSPMGSVSKVYRAPLQLILDSDAQMLPWESLPVVREFELYRMPSLGSVLALYFQYNHNIMDGVQLITSRHGSGGCDRSSGSYDLNRPIVYASEVTSIDTCNTFYILNPSGDLRTTQESFEDWFMRQPGWKGKAGCPPTTEEFRNALQDFDLFIYLGHGTGEQFFPERFIRQLDHCAATLLMGCSSGKLAPRGEYEPFGTVLSYLMAGCPSMIANLWDVTDGDIDRFSRHLLDKWTTSRMKTDPKSEPTEESVRKNEIDATVRDRQARYRTRSRPEGQPSNSNLSEREKFDPVRISSAVGKSRNACRLPYLIGASPVCYGVPTGLTRQPSIQQSDPS